MWRSKAGRRNHWNAAALDYSTRVVTWQITLASVPATVRPKDDPAGLALLYAVESSRVYLNDVRTRLLAEAQKLGIDNPELPEASWPSGNVVPLRPRESA